MQEHPETKGKKVEKLEGKLNKKKINPKTMMKIG